jgi:hypothetical protein
VRRAWHDRWSAFACALAAAAALAGAAARPDGAWREELPRRLASLAPERPAEYLELAEDVIDRSAGAPSAAADRELARRLAAIAGAIDVPGSGRSAALFLAEHSESDVERSRMLALADVLDPDSDSRAEMSERTDAVMALVRAFALYRRGEAVRARDAIGAAGAATLLDRHPEILQGGAARFLADCNAMRSAGPPAMSAQQLEALHALAAGAIAGAPRSWGESIAQGGAAPLPEIDVGDPKAIFGVDPAECLWRDGAWVRRPGSVGR